MPGAEKRQEKLLPCEHLFAPEVMEITIKPGLHILAKKGGGFDLLYQNPAIGGIVAVCYQDKKTGKNVDTKLIPDEPFSVNADSVVLLLEHSPERIIQMLILSRGIIIADLPENSDLVEA